VDHRKHRLLLLIDNADLGHILQAAFNDYESDLVAQTVDSQGNISALSSSISVTTLPDLEVFTPPP
jgi:hypothetical protein